MNRFASLVLKESNICLVGLISSIVEYTNIYIHRGIHMALSANVNKNRH